MPPLEHPLSLYAFVLIGVLAFRAIGSIIGAGRELHAGKPDHHPASVFPDAVPGRRDVPDRHHAATGCKCVAQFIPSTYLSTGLNAILAGNESIWQNLAGAAALIVTAVVGTFLAVKLFRWEKEEKMRSVGEVVAGGGARAVSADGRLAGLRQKTT